MLFFKAALAAVAGGVLMLMLIMFRQNLATIKERKALDVGTSFLMVFGPTFVGICCVIVIVMIVLKR